MRFNSEDLIAVDIFLERRKSRQYVGRLFQEKSNKHFFRFDYNINYLTKSNAIPLGPDLPLTKQSHRSKNLFASFQDRIPSKKNPAYVEYCKSRGISVDEKNVLVLLATIGRRGPSAFIFEPLFEAKFDKVALSRFRRELGLSVREFSAAFDIAPSTLQRVELGHGTGKEILKRLEIYYLFPQVALWELSRSGQKLHETKLEKLKSLFKEKVRIRSLK